MKIFDMNTLSAVTLSYARQTVRTLSRIWSTEGFASAKCRIWLACHQDRHCEGKGKTSSLPMKILIFLQHNMRLHSTHFCPISFYTVMPTQVQIRHSIQHNFRSTIQTPNTHIYGCKYYAQKKPQNMCTLLISSMIKWKDNDYILVKTWKELVMAPLVVPS